MVYLVHVRDAGEAVEQLFVRDAVGRRLHQNEEDVDGEVARRVERDDGEDERADRVGQIVPRPRVGLRPVEPPDDACARDDADGLDAVADGVDHRAAHVHVAAVVVVAVRVAVVVPAVAVPVVVIGATVAVAVVAVRVAMVVVAFAFALVWRPVVRTRRSRPQKRPVVAMVARSRAIENVGCRSHRGRVDGSGRVAVVAVAVPGARVRAASEPAVGVGMAAEHENARDDEVNREPRATDEEHHVRLDALALFVRTLCALGALGHLDKPRHGLVDDHTRERPHEEHGPHRAHDLRAVPAETQPLRTRPRGDEGGGEREAERGDISEEVHRVGQHGERVRADPEVHLHTHEEEAKHDGADQRPLRPPRPLRDGHFLSNPVVLLLLLKQHDCDSLH
mmetsp:Transcript_3605/g.11281  ORF Transcript_3605/g.11281 Transcript_3605/m.11281 type:complete len:393 (-) Transcript_3605:139-1317(-)